MNVAIIAAAGQGVRMGSKRAKQFLELDGIPVIIHTLTRFEQCPDIAEVVVVLPEKDIKGFPALARKYGLRKVKDCVSGGKTRAQSVWRGLTQVDLLRVEIVAVHDGVRPFVTPEEISRTVRAVKRNGGAILVAPITDTIKVVQGSRVLGTISRTGLRRALTPQCFDRRLLRLAFEGAGRLRERCTDESMLVERTSRGGAKIAYVDGNPRNIKITQPEDIALAEIILKQNPDFRIKKPK